jgi:hypothetical protein
MHLAFHVLFKTLDIAYILIKVNLTLTMACILVKMCLAPHVLLKNLVMVYAFIKTQPALAMAYVHFETCLVLIMKLFCQNEPYP